MVALAVFVTFPRVSQGWAGRVETLATSIAGFSDQISLGQFGSTILGNPEIVLRVEFPEGPPEDIASLHWRGRSYDRFDGIRWRRSRSLSPSALPRFYRDRWSGGVIDPQERWGDMVEDMSEEQFAVMRGPERDGRHHTVPRLEVRDGQVSVSYDAAGDRYSAKFRKPGEKQS